MTGASLAERPAEAAQISVPSGERIVGCLVSMALNIALFFPLVGFETNIHFKQSVARFFRRCAGDAAGQRKWQYLNLPGNRGHGLSERA